MILKKSEQPIYKEYIKNINDETASKLYDIIDNTKIESLINLKAL